MFFCPGFRRWGRRRGVQVRYSAVGKHGSIAIIERSFRTPFPLVALPAGRSAYPSACGGWFGGRSMPFRRS